ncbi:putative exporter [Xanthomonas arboricola]|nr:putative exporter [Xanthomonas arboricola]
MAFKLNANRRIGLALLWLALLAVAGFWLSETLKVTGDLRKFMPARSNGKAPAQSHAARAAGRRSAGTARLAHGV